ncbi:MAG: hypothetical protein RMJ56_08805 [Gemmataceae bacterium]|nr:hypothetical protein [Gemmata sp.]MDW8197685.1 hypothetical protein [Gemmataceae bacterium]
MTPWHRNEYILKGLFLGLWTFFALQVPADPAEARIDIVWVLGWVGWGLLASLIAGTIRLIVRGAQPWHNWKSFPLLVLLENPRFIYAGILLGLMCGVFSGREFGEPFVKAIAGLWTDPDAVWRVVKHEPPVGDWLTYCAIGGAILGFGLYRMRQMEDNTWRFFIGLVIAAVMVYLASEYIMDITVPDKADPQKRVPLFDSADARFHLGIYLLLGLPFFYILTFSGEAEESEVEIMVLCGMLGIALHLIGFARMLGGTAPFLIPMAIYFVYATRLLPGLRVFKHVLRGFSYMQAGALALAIRFFRRALELNPASELANEGMLRLHRNLTLSTLENDPELVEALDFRLCLDRAAALLMTPPSPAARDEAEKFLNLVEKKKPALLARVDYLRAVALVHAKDYAAAAEVLSRVLNPETPGYHPAVRQQVLFEAWSLALDGPSPLTERLGWPELNKPGRRMELIGAVERQLKAQPNHAKAKEYQTMLYSQLTESEFVAAAVLGLPTDFNYDYVEQLGYQLVDDNDPDRRERGMAYLRIAGRGLPARGPSIFKKLADVAEKLGHRDEMRSYTEQIKTVAEAVGPANLAKEQRDIYLKALQKLAAFAEEEGDAIKAEADAADARGDSATRQAKDAEAKPYYEAAIREWRAYRDGGGGQLREMYRKVAELYAKMRDPLNALVNCTAGLQYDSTDADLLRKRDSYYYSVPIERLAEAKDRVKGWFDVSYCIKKAMSVLNLKEADADLLDWATHLTRLAKVMEPTSNRVRFAEARCLLRRGERATGIQLLEDIRESEKGSGDEEEAWYNANKLLGQLYLEELGRPDLALRAFVDFKNYHKSGADTLFQIARCYEALGDLPQAIKFYNAVTAYTEHPRYWEAKDALRRLGKG